MTQSLQLTVSHVIFRRMRQSSKRPGYQTTCCPSNIFDQTAVGCIEQKPLDVDVRPGSLRLGYAPFQGRTPGVGKVSVLTSSPAKDENSHFKDGCQHDLSKDGASERDSEHDGMSARRVDPSCERFRHRFTSFFHSVSSGASLRFSLPSIFSRSSLMEYRLAPWSRRRAPSVQYVHTHRFRSRGTDGWSVVRRGQQRGPAGRRGTRRVGE